MSSSSASVNPSQHKENTLYIEPEHRASHLFFSSLLSILSEKASNKIDALVYCLEWDAIPLVTIFPLCDYVG